MNQSQLNQNNKRNTMITVKNKDLLTCFNNLEACYDRLLTVVSPKNETVRSAVAYSLNKFNKLRPQLKSSKVTEEFYETLMEALEDIDGFYDLVENYPDEIGIPDTFTRTAIPLLTQVALNGITELDKELLYLKGNMTPHYSEFNFNL